MNKKYIVSLTDDERAMLIGLVGKGKAAAHKIKHANRLLKADVASLNGNDDDIAQADSCAIRTVFNIRQRFVEQGLEAALERKKRKQSPIQAMLDGEKEARLLQMAGSEPPPGDAKWTLKGLADEGISLHVVDTLSPQTVRRTLKKTN